MKRRKRGYKQGVRREQAMEMRDRIAAATAQLHEEIGPRHTTIKAIAERAGVERLTVYRHFPDDQALFQACSSCWLEQHPVPDPAGWSDPALSPVERVGRALRALQAYYSVAGRMLRQIARDRTDLPALDGVAKPFDQYLIHIADQLSEAWHVAPPLRPRLRVVLRHIVQFSTWDSLNSQAEGGVDPAELLLTWVVAVAGKR
jgi:AcrR family transcriptional regulator